MGGARRGGHGEEGQETAVGLGRVPADFEGYFWGAEADGQDMHRVYAATRRVLETKE